MIVKELTDQLIGKVDFDKTNSFSTAFLDYVNQKPSLSRIDYHGRSICYVTDNELFPADNEFHDPTYLKKLINFVQGADVLITDTTYTNEEYETKIGWGHSRISEVVDLAHQAEVKNLYLFHHDPDQSDDDIDTKIEIAKKLFTEANSKTICHAPIAESRIQI